jgi:hypothetical protein
MTNISYIAAFIIGAILFAIFWKLLFGLASSLVVLAGMIGAATAVTLYWLRNENRHHGKGKQ